MSDLRIRPWTVKRALAFNRTVHRRLPAVHGGMWSIRALNGDETIGAIIVGWPNQTWTTGEADTLCVLRLAVKEGHKNACSMLYSAAWRAARATGADSLVTYTHLDESGTSLKASGWIDGGLTSGGEWDRPGCGRPRQAVIDSERKRRWWAPGSRRLSDGSGTKGDKK